MAPTVEEVEARVAAARRRLDADRRARELSTEEWAKAARGLADDLDLLDELRARRAYVDATEGTSSAATFE
jgi:hypothetical protein